MNVHRSSRLLLSLACLATAGIGLAESAQAQTGFPYVISESSRTYSPLTGGTTLSFTSSSRDDGGELVDIGFDFTYFGETYRFVNVGVNGVMSFAASCATASCQQGSCNATSRVCQETFFSTSPPFGSPSLPNQNRINGFVAPFWDDLILGSGSSISVGTVGTAPRREFVIEWEAIQRFSSSLSTGNFQVRLEEGSNVVRIAYGTFGSAADNRVWSGLIGAESPDGRTGLTTLTCAASNNCVAQDLIDLNNRVLEISLPDGAELTGDATAPTGGDVGAPLPVALTVRNIGTNTTTVGFEARVYMSTDGTIERTDRELGVLNYPALVPGASNTQTLNTVVPNLPLGVYTIGALVDTSSVVPEAIETNNVVIARARFLIGSDISASVSAPSSGGIGDPLPITVNVLNEGSAQSAVGVDVYLSRDTTLDGSDTKIGTATSAVAAVPSTPVVVAANVPSNFPEGSFNVIAVVDPGNRISESDETNNVVASSGQVSFVAADLYVPGIAADREIAFRGQEITVTTEIENEGGSTARGFDYDFYLSTNELISRISDPFLGTAGPLVLAPGERTTVTHTFTISSTLAINQYYVGVIVNSNGRVTETNINDNIRRTRTRIVIRDPGADFSVAQVATPAGAAAGERLIIERAIFNLGNAAGTTTYDVYLSEDANVDPMTDLLLLSGSANIAVGGEDFGIDQVQLSPSIPEGNYYVLYRLDGADTVDELDETNNDGGIDAPITLAGVRLAILTESLPFGTVDVPYGAVLGAVGGAGAYVWTISSGMLPDGLALDAMSGSIAGTPTREGVATFTLSVSDGRVAVERDFTVLVAEANEPPEVLTRALPPAFENRPYQQQLTVYGGAPPFTWELRGNLPTGMTFDPNGIIRGTPTSVDLRMFSVIARDALGASADRILVLRVARPGSSVRLSAMALPDGRIGDPYEATLGVAENTGEMPYEFTILEGALPPGLALNDRTISGSPTRAGIYDVTVRVVDAIGDADVNRYIIEISERNGVRFLTTTLPAGEIGSAYLEEDGDPIRLRAVTEQGSDEVTFTRVGGALPTGVSLTLDGTVTGTPARTGVFDFVVRAEDTAGQTSLRAFGLLIEDPPLPPPPPMAEPSGCACAAPARDVPLAGWLVVVFAAMLGLRRRRGAGLLALGAAWALTLGGATTAEAQTFDYRTTVRNQAYVERTTGGTRLTFPSSDDSSTSITLPFDFRYFGTDHGTVQVSTNGYVVFPGGGSSTSLSNQSLPNRFAPNNLIALWWDDLETSGEEWFLEGTAPNRRVVIQYKNANRLGDRSSGQVRVQLHLFEGRSRFEVHYGGVANAGGGSPFWTFSTGYENQSGQLGDDFLGCGSGCNRPSVPNGVVYAVEEDGGTDVVARSISSPVAVFPGSPVDLSFELGSVHANPLGPFGYAVYLVPAAQTEPTGTPLITNTISLQPFEVRAIDARASVPGATPLGRYRFALVVDTGGVINEPNETNNLVFSDFVRVNTPRPDFLVPSVTTPDTMVAPGGMLRVSFDLRNDGGVAGDVDYSVVLSRNEVVTADDRAIDSARVNVAAITTSSISRTITLPNDLIPGEYTLGVVVDPMNSVQEGSEVNNSGAATGRLLVAGANLAIANQSLPAPFLGVPYTVYLSAVGGNGTYDWSLASGTLPRGLLLIPSTGEIRGTPLETGSFDVTVEVGSGSAMASQSYSLVVEEPVGGFSITTRQLLPGLVGQDYPPDTGPDEVQTLRTIGGTGTVEFSLDSPAPPGISLSAEGVFSGVPTQAGRFSVDVRAVDGAGEEATRTLFLTVGEPGRITLVADALPDARVGESYAFQLRSIGASPTSTPTYSSDGALPPGIVVATTGAVGGTPRQVGTFNFPVTVTEGEGRQSDTALFRIRVGADDSLSFRIEGTTTTTVGSAIDISLVAVGGTPPFSWRGGEELPDEMTSEVEGPEGNVYRIRGRLDAPELVTVLASVTDSDRRVFRQAVTLRFQAAPPPPPMDDGGSGCRAVGRTRTAGLELGLGLLALGGLLRRRQRR